MSNIDRKGLFDLIMIRIGKVLALLLILNLVAIVAWLLPVWRAHLSHAAVPLTPAPQMVWITNTVTLTNFNRFHWSQVESEDYHTYVANLRAIGCPQQTIRDIVIADLDLLWASRLRSIYLPQGRRHYWESWEAELLNNYDQREWQRQERAIDREKREVLRDLIGIDLATERVKLRGKEDPLGRQLTFLPVGKRIDVRNVLERAQEQVWLIREKQWEEGTPLTSEDRTQLQQIRQQHETALDQLLSPQERQLADLWISESAQAARHDTYGMDATEEEFLAVYNLRKKFDQAWPADQVDFNDPQAAARWETAKAQLDQEIEAALGQERFTLYQRGQDEDFHLLNRTISRYGLPREKAILVYEFKRILESERQRIALDSTLSLTQKESTLSAMNDEAKIAVKEVLTENGYNYYRRKTNWLKP